MLGGYANNRNFPIGGGAATCYINGVLNIYNSCFVNNLARNSDGGAVLNGNSASVPLPGVQAFQASTTINNCEFIGNRSDGNGGAIASEPNTHVFVPPIVIAPSDLILNVSNSDFEKNSAKLLGGAIYLNTTTATLIGNTYKCNKSSSGNAVDSVNSVVNVM